MKINEMENFKNNLKQYEILDSLQFNLYLEKKLKVFFKRTRKKKLIAKYLRLWYL